MRIIFMYACLILLCSIVCGCRSIATKSQSKNSGDISVKVTFSVDPEYYNLESDRCNLVFLITNISDHPIKMVFPLIETITHKGGEPKMDIYYEHRPIKDIEPKQSVLITGYTLKDFYLYYSELSVREKNFLEFTIPYYSIYPEKVLKFHKGSFCIDLDQEQFKKEIIGEVRYKRTNNIDVYILDPKLGIIKHYCERPKTAWKEWPIMGK